MIRFLIADDEPWIREGLRASLSELVDEDFVCIEAEDGLETLEKAKEFLPDVLLLDIQMPRLKGLDLVERLNAMGRDWLILIVTGYAEFDYARRALELHVFDFLLKPVLRADFGLAISKVLTEVRDRREKRRFAVWSREKLVEQKTLLIENLLKDWTSGLVKDVGFRDSAGYLDLVLPQRPYVLVVGLWEPLGEDVEKTSATEGSRLLGTMRQIASTLSNGLLFEDAGRHTVLIFSLDNDPGEKKVWETVTKALDQGFRAVPLLEGRALDDPRLIPTTCSELAARIDAKRSENRLIGSAKAYIDSHHWKHLLSADEVAERLKISPGHLSRLLKAATGLTFVSYLAQVRTEKAIRLLEDPTVRISEVAERVGYRSQNYFARAFRAATGLTPKDFRNGRKRTEP